MSQESKWKYILVELGHHLPYSIFGITVGLIAMGILSFFAILMNAGSLLPVASSELFHVFHPAHVLISAVATTAMFSKHEKRIFYFRNINSNHNCFSNFYRKFYVNSPKVIHVSDYSNGLGHCLIGNHPI